MGFVHGAVVFFLACTPELSYDQTMRLLMVKVCGTGDRQRLRFPCYSDDVHAALLFRTRWHSANHFKQPVDKQILSSRLRSDHQIFTRCYTVGSAKIDRHFRRELFWASCQCITSMMVFASLPNRVGSHPVLWAVTFRTLHKKALPMPAVPF